MSSAWPELSYEQWHATCDTLHAHTQILGKLAVKLAPPEPQLQHTALRLTARGWATAPLPAPDGSGSLVVALDLHVHEVLIEHSDGRAERVVLTPNRPVGEVTREVLAAVRALGGPVHIDPTPQEVPWSVPLDKDKEHAHYDPGQVAGYFAAATQAALVLAAYRAPYRGRSTPVNAWWGGFDLAVSLFSGASADPPSNDFIMRNAMDSQEVAVGWWPGDTRYGKAARVRVRVRVRAPSAGRFREHDPLAAGCALGPCPRRVHPRLGRHPVKPRSARSGSGIRALGVPSGLHDLRVGYRTRRECRRNTPARQLKEARANGAGRVVWHDERVNGHLVKTDGTQADLTHDEIKRTLGAGELLWLDFADSGEDTIAVLRDVFGLHPLAIEDAQEFRQRPKLEDYDDFVYLVAYGAQAGADPMVEVHCIYSERFLVTVHHTDCAVFTEVREGLKRHRGKPLTELIALHHVLDALVDSLFPYLAEFDDRIDTLQDQIFVKPTEQQLSTLSDMKRQLVTLRRLVTPQRDVMSSLLSGVVELPGMTTDGERYFRDLYDHLIRISDLVDSYRDLLSGSMDDYLSMVSNRLNDVMKQLTIIATIFLPLSFLTGFFGQNFAWLVARMGSLTTFIGVGIGTEVVAVIGLLVLFKKRGWM